ncbi:breast carcinoma-amplified sequence 4 isoform X2 [Marmota flaviventris]|uniref:breast carcinoma-amplified sequence 4 isoform X2 n=1 Tax=Marmota flaviventris TaxID=93162 RepID=UPI003A84BA7C
MLLVDADSPEPVRSGAHELALFLTPEPGAEARAVEAAIEGLLVALEDLSLATCRFLFQIRSDTSQILEENVPVLKAKVTEMRGIYAKVDRLEAPPGPGPPASELPALYRTEDYVPVDAPEAEHQSR